MQKVEIYYDILEAKWDMEKHINLGWKVHICTMSYYDKIYSHGEHILVVYQRTVE